MTQLASRVCFQRGIVDTAGAGGYAIQAGEPFDRHISGIVNSYELLYGLAKKLKSDRLHFVYFFKRAERGGPRTPLMILSTTLHQLRLVRAYIETSPRVVATFVTIYSSAGYISGL